MQRNKILERIRQAYRLKPLCVGCLVIVTVVTLNNVFHLFKLNRPPKVDDRTNLIARGTNDTARGLVKHIHVHEFESNTRLKMPSNVKSGPDRDIDHRDKSRAKEEVRHIAFLKVHKAGSSTIQNILYRFGIQRNLTFVLSANSHYLSKSKYNYAKVLPLHQSKGKRRKFDILCNHAVFNLEKFKEFLYPDAEYVAIVREPLDLLISAAYYYRYVWPAEYLKKIDTSAFIQTLLQHPERYEPENLEMSRTYNYMTRDFGLVLGSIDTVKNITETQFQRFLDDVSETFKVVLIMERFDESLVLMKRYFHWSLKDIIYLKNNAYKAKAPRVTTRNITSSDWLAFNRSHWMDIRLYEHFYERFMKQVEIEVDFEEEVQCFKTYLSDIQKFCSEFEGQQADNIVLQKTQFSEAFTVSRNQCKLMVLSELKFYRNLVDRHNILFNVNSI